MDQKDVQFLEWLSHYEACPSCSGSGLRLGDMGDPELCNECKGSSWVRARDAKGRFI